MENARKRSFSFDEMKQATGIKRTVLRNWETRFEIALSERDDQGRRCFSEAHHIKVLQEVSTLIQSGLRPQFIFTTYKNVGKLLSVSGQHNKHLNLVTASDSQKVVHQKMGVDNSNRETSPYRFVENTASTLHRKFGKCG